MPKQGPMKWPLPDVVNPPDTVCFQINVPNERHHLGAFYGAMFLLSKAYAWGDDPDHTALAVAAVWRKIFDNIIAGNCTIPDKPGSAGVDSGDELMIRQNPDNPCLLETSVNGVDWCVWADLSLCTPANPQPGTGTPQPQPGDCQTYHGVTGAAAPWYVPTVVSDGDTIELLFSQGSWNDGGEVAWRLSNGDQFFAGNNVGNPVLNGADPLPAEPHMAMLALIDGVYYNLAAGAVTVPSGVSNAQILLLPNDSVLDNNAGTITFDIKVCNNQAGDWTSTLDFTTNSFAEITTVNTGEWTAGVGYTGIFVDVNDVSEVQLLIPVTSCHIKGMDMYYSTPGCGGANGLIGFETDSGFYGSPGVVGPTTNGIYTQNVDRTGVTAVVVDNNSGTEAGTTIVTKWVIRGTGPKPPQLP